MCGIAWVSATLSDRRRPHSKDKRGLKDGKKCGPSQTGPSYEPNDQHGA